MIASSRFLFPSSSRCGNVASTSSRGWDQAEPIVARRGNATPFLCWWLCSTLYTPQTPKRCPWCPSRKIFVLTSLEIPFFICETKKRTENCNFLFFFFVSHMKNGCVPNSRSENTLIVNCFSNCGRIIVESRRDSGRFCNLALLSVPPSSS